MKNSWWRKRPTPGARFRQLLVFLWYTGCRPGEAAKLKWADIDFKRQRIVLMQHKTARTQRVARPRLVPLHPVVLTVVNGGLDIKTVAELMGHTTTRMTEPGAFSRPHPFLPGQLFDASHVSRKSKGALTRSPKAQALHLAPERLIPKSAPQCCASPAAAADRRAEWSAGRHAPPDTGHRSRKRPEPADP